MGVEGTWYNQLGSVMELQVDGNRLTGTYRTAVGQGKGEYDLQGARVKDPSTAEEALAFSVAWVNKETVVQSVTSWAGQWRELAGQEAIYTMWLLVREREQHDNWEATLVGQDTFTRSAPPPAEQPALARQGPASFPQELDD